MFNYVDANMYNTIITEQIFKTQNMETTQSNTKSICLFDHEFQT